MKSTEFLAEGDDKNIDDVQANHPEIYRFLVERMGYMALNQQSTVEAYNTANSHMVVIKIKPSAGLGNTKAGLESDGVSYESMNNPMDGTEVISGSVGDMHWTYSTDDVYGNVTETWRFALPVDDIEEDIEEDTVDDGEPRKEKLDLHSVFGSDAANVLRQEGIKFYEKPSYWSDLERKAMDDEMLMTAKFALKDEGMELKEYPAWEIYSINPASRFSYVKGPLQSVENLPKEKVFVIYDLPYSDERRDTSEPQTGRFLVDTQGAQSYIRSWIMIK